jgi:hypothetical protein
MDRLSDRQQLNAYFFFPTARPIDPSVHHQPKKNLLIHARLIASKVPKAINAPRWCVTTGLPLTGWFIA